MWRGNCRGGLRSGGAGRSKAGADFPQGLSVANSLQRSPKPFILGNCNDGVECSAQSPREKTDITPSDLHGTEYVGEKQGS